jgi:hypothetical protein
LAAESEQPIRVACPLTDRAEYLTVTLTYRADPGASVTISLQTLAGVVLDAGPTLTGGQLPSTRDTESRLVAPWYRYAISEVSTGDSLPGGVVRPLAVPAGSAGATVQVVVTPSIGAGTRIQVLGVAVYELAPDEVPR